MRKYTHLGVQSPVIYGKIVYGTTKQQQQQAKEMRENGKRNRNFSLFFLESLKQEQKSTKSNGNINKMD